MHVAGASRLGRTRLASTGGTSAEAGSVMVRPMPQCISVAQAHPELIPVMRAYPSLTIDQAQRYLAGDVGMKVHVELLEARRALPFMWRLPWR